MVVREGVPLPLPVAISPVYKLEIVVSASTLQTIILHRPDSELQFCESSRVGYVMCEIGGVWVGSLLNSSPTAMNLVEWYCNLVRSLCVAPSGIGGLHCLPDSYQLSPSLKVPELRRTLRE